MMLFQINEQEDLKQVLAAADGFIQGIDAGNSFIQTSKIQNALSKCTTVHARRLPGKGWIAASQCL